MGKKISNFLKGEIISSVFYILFGLCLVVLTEQTVNVICKVVFGLVMVGAGIYHVCIYAAEKENSTILDLFTGVIALVLGGFLFFTPQIIIKLLPYLLGAFVLVDNIWTLKGAWKLKKLGNTQWKVLFIGSIVFIVLGILAIVYPFTKVIYTVIFAGYVMLADGVSDIVFLILLKKGIKKGVIVKTEEASEADTAENAEEKTSVESEAVDEGEAEEALENEIIINGRWKSIEEDSVSPANEINEMKEQEEAAIEETTEEIMQEAVQIEEIQDTEIQEKEVLEEWKD